MADRGTNNSPNTRNPEHPHSHPSRIDQYGEEIEKNLSKSNHNHSSKKK